MDGIDEIIQVPIYPDNGWPQILLDGDKEEKTDRYFVWKGVTNRNERLIYQEITEKVCSILIERNQRETTE